jgi:hypothetical protein
MILSYHEAKKLQEFLKFYCPVDTGNLRMGIQKAQKEADGYVIVIGVPSGSEIAGKNSDEYAELTDEPLLKNGKPNRNAGWVEKAIESWRAWLNNGGNANGS